MRSSRRRLSSKSSASVPARGTSAGLATARFPAMASTGGSEEEAAGWVPLTSSKMSGSPVERSGFGAGVVGVTGVEEAGLRPSSRGPRVELRLRGEFDRDRPRGAAATLGTGSPVGPRKMVGGS